MRESQASRLEVTEAPVDQVVEAAMGQAPVDRPEPGEAVIVIMPDRATDEERTVQERPERTVPLARPTVVAADDAWAEAGRTVLRVQLGRMLARVDGVLEGREPEEVHAMRVAARRMRAAWRVFGDGFERGPRRRYLADLRAIGRRLGAVRDLDVLLGMLDSYEQRVGRRERVALLQLGAAWRSERAARHEVLVAALRSAAFGEFVAEYEALVDTDGAAALAADAGPRRVRDRLPSRVWRAYETVWSYDEGIEDADIARLHALRISGKWLRYTLEFGREPMRPESTRLIAPVVALQDHIGELHDLHVAAETARAMLASSTPVSGRERAAIERFADAMDRRADRLRRRLGRTWAPLVASDYRRRLGRALARL